MDNIKERRCNIELLRILAMLMVVSCHYVGHSNLNFDLETNIGRINLFISKFCNWGLVANNVFIIITGYFLIESKFKIKKIVSLIFETLFYSISFMFLIYFINSDMLSIKNLIKAIFPIIWNNWFVIYYIILYVISPFLNEYLKSISAKKHKQIIILLTFLFYVVPTFTNNAWGFTRHDYFILAYLIGAYIRMYYDVEKKDLLKKNIFVFLIVIVFLIIYINMMIIFFKDNCNVYKLAGYIIENDFSIINLILAINLFIIFKNIKIYWKKINTISQSVIGVYLIHENMFLQEIIWNKISPASLYQDNWCFAIHLIIKVLIVFILALIIDKIRLMLFKKIEIKIEDKIINIINYIKERI